MANKRNDNILLNGCALVIDDEIFKPTEAIYKMVGTLEKNGTYFVKLESLPPSDVIESFSSLSFVILDWKFQDGDAVANLGGARIGAAHADIEREEKIKFISKLVQTLFIPVFIFSNEDGGNIKTTLESDESIKEAILKGRIILKSKSELTGSKIITYLNNWLKNNKTVLTLKKFEQQLIKSKNTFLVELGGLNSDWVNIVYSTICQDYSDIKDAQKLQLLVNREFNEFLINSMLSRIVDASYDDVKFAKKAKVEKGDIAKIYESIKFFRYSNDINNGQAYEGDIYQKFSNNAFRSEFLISVNAPCDLRKGKLLLLRGKPKEKYRPHNVSSYFIPFLLEKRAVEFRYDDRIRIDRPLDLSKVIDGETEYRRIGRISHPYITAVRSEFAHFISRQGIPRHPK